MELDNAVHFLRLVLGPELTLALHLLLGTANKEGLGNAVAVLGDGVFLILVVSENLV